MNKFTLSYLFSILLIILPSFATAQNIDVQGIITDEKRPLPGVSIFQKGNENVGTISDSEGNYKISDIPTDATLIVSLVGYVLLEIPINGKSKINVVLVSDTKLLDDIVVIGYGSITKSQITSSIETVKGEELERYSASSPAEALQGKAGGTQVLSAGGDPGSSPQILIRGITTNLGSSPLIVLDGIPLSSDTSLNFINSNDIESFQILKDASATAIFGSRASNGAILIKTKRGVNGVPVFNASISYGFQNVQKIEVAGKDEYIQVQNLRRTNDGEAELFNSADNTVNTDWWNEVIKNNAPMMKFNIGALGGSEKMKYSTSFDYFKQKSIYSKGLYQRVSARLNLDFKLHDKVALKQDINPRIEELEATPNELGKILRITPLVPVFLPESEQVDKNQYSVYSFGTNETPNPVGSVHRLFDTTKTVSVLSNSELIYEVIPDLNISTQFALNFSNTRRDRFFPDYFETNFFKRVNNEVTRDMNDRFDYVWNNTINYKKQIGDKHYIDGLAGILFDYQSINNLSGTKDKIPDSDDVNLRFLDAATGEKLVVGGVESVETIFSVIGRVIYSYENRYYVTATIRRDASSKFSEENRVGYFPSVSLAWDIDSEKFFNVGWVSNLRLKGGYGEVGNQNIPNDSQFFAVGSGDYVFNQTRVSTSYLSNFGNPNLTWETVKDINIGVSGTLLKDKINFSIEYYNKISEDLLFLVTLPGYTGVPGTVAKNIGSFTSKGWDFQIGYNNKKSDFQYGVNLIVSTNESIAEKLAPGNEEILGHKIEELGNRYLKITKEGKIVGALYGRKTNGIFQSADEVNKHASSDGTLLQPNAKPGDLRFVDNNKDGKIDDNDLTEIGNPFPLFYGGINIDLKYKNFDLVMQWYGTYGNDVVNHSRINMYSGALSDGNVAKGTLNKVWSESNKGATFPRLSIKDQNGNYKVPSDLFIEDGSYLRLRNIQLGYNIKVPGFKNVRTYISTQNLFTITKYSGFDPEVQAGTDVVTDFGVDLARNPVSRTYLIGVNLTF